MFKYQNHLSKNLNFGLDMIIDRLDMNQRDREIFYDIINFAFHEGRIAGKEEILEGVKSTENQDDK